MTLLRYPLEVGGTGSPDYMQFKPVRYRANRVRAGQGAMPAEAAAAPGVAGAMGVVLYMPNSTPPASNVNEWGDTGNSLAGPLGDAKRVIGGEFAQVVQDTEDFQSFIPNLVDGLKDTAQGIQKAGGGAAKQLALQMAANTPFMASPIQLMSIEKGRVYNPNVELFYTQPRVRSFNFNFKLIPKSPVEAAAVNAIIKNFKKWSAPKKIEGGMMEIPYVWEVAYKTGGLDNPNMNKFKKMACTNVTAQANPGTDMHVAHEMGMPIEMVLSLGFMEVDIITRDDHDTTMQGF